MIKELLDQIYGYVHGVCTLQDLESWVVLNLQRIFGSGDAEAIELANRIDANLIELGENLIEETAFLEYLQSYISSKQTIPIIRILNRPRGAIIVTAGNETTQILAEIPDQVQTIRLAPASV